MYEINKKEKKIIKNNSTCWFTYYILRIKTRDLKGSYRTDFAKALLFYKGLKKTKRQCQQRGYDNQML
jgi:hypothetical protein